MTYRGRERELIKQAKHLGWEVNDNGQIVVPGLASIGFTERSLQAHDHVLKPLPPTLKVDCKPWHVKTIILYYRAISHPGETRLITLDNVVYPENPTPESIAPAPQWLEERMAKLKRIHDQHCQEHEAYLKEYKEPDQDWFRQLLHGQHCQEHEERLKKQKQKDKDVIVSHVWNLKKSKTWIFLRDGLNLTFRLLPDGSDSILVAYNNGKISRFSHTQEYLLNLYRMCVVLVHAHFRDAQHFDQRRLVWDKLKDMFPHVARALPELEP